MVILRDVPFERQARFLHDNVCRYPEGPEFAQALSALAGELPDVDVAAGLKAHHDALRGIYADLACVEGKGDKARYAELANTVAFLYAAFAFGTLAREGNGYSVRIDKAVLQQEYRKGSVAKRVRHLAYHGFSVRYLSPEGKPTSLSQASRLSIAYDRHPHLVPALQRFAASIASLPEATHKTSYNKLGIFMKADYPAAFLRVPIPRDALDPLRDDILATVDTYRQEWLGLVGRLRDECGLACSGIWGYGASPAWGVSFSAKGERPLAIFTLGSNIVFIEFTLPIDAAERIIRERQSYSDAIRERIESFHCVQCPKECKGSNMHKIDGVWLCKGRAEARRIYITLSSPRDFESIHSMLGFDYYPPGTTDGNSPMGIWFPVRKRGDE